MESRLTFEAEPFEGYTEFDEMEAEGEESFEWSGELPRRKFFKAAARRPPARPRRRPPARPLRRPHFRFPRVVFPRVIPRPYYPVFGVPAATLNIADEPPADDFPEEPAGEPPADDAGGADAAPPPEASAAGTAADSEPAEGQSEFGEWEWFGEEAEASSDPAGSIGPLTTLFGRGLEGPALRLAILRGERDENRLTNQVFFSRHPERAGRSIGSNERSLAAEWLEIRDALVRPALAETRGGTPAPSPGGAVPIINGTTQVSNDVGEFAAKLGATWSSRRGGNPSPEAIRDWLLQNHQDTLRGAAARFGKRYSAESLTRAWMISQEEQMKFQTLAPKGIRFLKNFRPPSTTVQRVTSPLIPGSDKEQVAPVVVRFVEELRRRYPGVSASTYRGHGGGSFNGKGYSLDLFIDSKSPRDERGFYKPQDAVALARAVGEAARAVNLEWWLIYNDFSVANVINREAGVTRVIYVGAPVKEGKGIRINWHGPHPLILHFHLDLGVVG